MAKMRQIPLTVLILFAALLLAPCSKKKSERPAQKDTAAIASGYRLSRADSILLIEAAAKRVKRKVIVLGFDAATWNVLDPMIEKGQLPNFKKIMDKGSYGDLQSTPFFLTPPAWTSMFSGCKSWKTGVYGFGKPAPETREFIPVHSDDVRAPRIWDMAGQAGLKTAVIKVPMTYPAAPVNGIMVTGFLTPGQVIIKKVTTTTGAIRRIRSRQLSKHGLHSFSPPFKAQVKIYDSDVTVYLLDSVKGNAKKYDEAFMVIHESEAAAGALAGDNSTIHIPEQTAACPIGGFTDWVRILVHKDSIPYEGRVRLEPSRTGGSVISIRCTPVYGYLPGTDVNFCYPDSLRKAIAARFDRFTPNISYVVPVIPDHVDDNADYLKFFFNYDDWDLFIYQFQVTDIIQHWDGDGPYTQDVFERIDKLLGEFVRMLPEDAVLIMASDHGSREYTSRINLNTWLDHMGLIAKDLKGNLDSRNSIAYHMDWGIYVNKKELRARWSAVRGFKPGSEETVYDDFLDYLIAQAKAITAARMIEPLVIKMWRSPAAGVGPAPDLVVGAEYPEYAVEPNDLFHMGQNLIDSAFKKGKKFHHRRTGMFIAMGKGIKKGYKAEMQDIFDITPTVLYLLGLPQADYFDGKVMESIFEEEFLSKNRRKSIAAYSLPANKAKEKDLNREKLEEKLRAIGYVQ